MIDLESALLANESVIPHIYEAVVTPAHWEEAVRRIVDFLDSFSGMITVSYPASGKGEVLCSAGFPEWATRAWQERHSNNEWVQLAASVPAGRVLHAASTIDVSQLADTPMGRELLEPQDIRDAVGVKMTDSPLFVGAISAYRTSEYHPETLDRLAFLAPHLARGFALHQRLSAEQARLDAVESGLDALSAGIVLLRKGRVVVHANRAAHRILQEADGLALREDRLVPDAIPVQRALEDIVQATLQPGRDGFAAGGLLRIDRPSGRRAYSVVVSPAPGGVLDARSEACVVLWITDPEALIEPQAELVETLLDLTPAEARLASALAGGRSVRQYAEDAGIREGTARWTLKQVFAKTRTNSQAQLVRLILQGIPSPPL